MRAAIADITPAHIRGTAYGIFNTAYGLAWFIGASLMGFLYGISIKYIFGFVVITQVIAASVLFLLITLKRQLPASPAY
jgi:MFS family permease